MSTDPPPPPDERYRTEEFTFVDTPDDLSEGAEATHWLQFMNSRAGRRVERREQARERVALLAALAVVIAVVAAVVAWQPWSSEGPADTGAEFLGADRVAVLMQVQAPDNSADATAILIHDRGGGPEGVTVVPAAMVLSVEGQSRLSVGAALAEAGPTLTREALAELVGVPLVGTWLLTASEFAALSERVGRQAPLGTDSTVVARTLQAFVRAFPPQYSSTRDLLLDFGILAAPGLSVERLAAVLTALALRGDFLAAALPLDPGTGELDVDAAGSTALADLGGQPGQGRSDATPRVLVSIARGAGVRESDVRADVLNAGYEYVAGPAADAAAQTVVTVRTSVSDAQAVGESIAGALGLPTSAVRLSDNLPLTADVAVVIARRDSTQRGERVGPARNERPDPRGSSG
ncbi:MAG: hypothetical protein ACT4P1_06630 [Sporichthyaceae bacterium]